MKVFISGSKETARYYRVRMPYPIREKLDRFMEADTEIIIGDCMGIDTDVQKYLNDNGYRNVTVYVAGRNRPARHNEDKWVEKHFDASYFNGFSMRVEKDIHLAEDKALDDIIDVIRESVVVIDILKPIYNLKAAE